MKFNVVFATKWADFDPNRHMRHTAYNDYAAEVRVRFFKAQGFSVESFAQENLGPILFKEETSFYKAIHLGENITVDLSLTAVSKNLERWKLEHHIFNEQGKLSATVNVYGAWIDLRKIKLAVPSEKFKDLFSSFENTADFDEIIVKS